MGLLLHFIRIHASIFLASNLEYISLSKHFPFSNGGAFFPIDEINFFVCTGYRREYLYK